MLVKETKMIYRSCAMVLVRLCWLVISLTKTWELVGTTKYAQSVAVGQTTDWRWCSFSSYTDNCRSCCRASYLQSGQKQHSLCSLCKGLYSSCLLSSSFLKTWEAGRDWKKGKFSLKKDQIPPKFALPLARRNICSSESVCGPATPALHHLLFATPERVELQKFCLKNNEIRGNS